MGAAASDIAERRQTDPVSLGRLVDGDLNSITMKALEKLRERRYPSVSDLAAAPFLTLISDMKVQEELRLMTAEIAQQICERTASAAVLEGSIARIGSQYVLGLRAKNCNTGNVLDQEQAVPAKREDVLNSLSQIGRKFRTRVGESLVTVERHSTPLPEATTTSLEALKSYSTGMKVVVLSSGHKSAIPFTNPLSKSIPNSRWRTPIWGFAHGAVGESGLSAESATRAWQLRDRVSDRDSKLHVQNHVTKPGEQSRES